MKLGVADPSAPSPGPAGLPDFTDVDLAGCAGSEHPVLSGVARKLLPRAEEAHASTVVAYYEDSPEAM
ncbi:YxD-tail cyclophane-containing RiPP peptide [Streptomyces mangrovisoli]|uniref:FXSXX-COOH protein n=1 Tax=Streptomyces mangrovisoli TaxID=1428628 RepID=A0A1J4NMM8_9ACTN|nr:YxD-tail cyclophane-containing RiPP peptide [Streptomyces mangrovisoli]OIJ63591.1 hypothetical protein WN71_032725 [Streptomyces mangrovisoli]